MQVPMKINSNKKEKEKEVEKDYRKINFSKYKISMKFNLNKKIMMIFNNKILKSNKIKNQRKILQKFRLFTLICKNMKINNQIKTI